MSIFLKILSNTLFVNCTFYVNKCGCLKATFLDIISLDIRIHLGQVVEELTENVTHILVHDGCHEEQIDLLKGNKVIVRPDWVKKGG